MSHADATTMKQRQPSSRDPSNRNPLGRAQRQGGAAPKTPFNQGLAEAPAQLVAGLLKDPKFARPHTLIPLFISMVAASSTCLCAVLGYWITAGSALLCSLAAYASAVVAWQLLSLNGTVLFGLVLLGFTQIGCAMTFIVYCASVDEHVAVFWTGVQLLCAASYWWISLRQFRRLGFASAKKDEASTL